MRDSLPVLFGERAVEVEQFFYSELRKYHHEGLRPMPGSERLLQMLTGRNVYMGVVSNKHGDLLRSEIKHLGWDHHFGRAIGARDTAFDKPSALPLLESLSQTNITPGHDVWFLGDSKVDMQCARSANCVPVSLSPRAVLDESPVISAKDCLGVIQILSGL
jgi:phosphoglycolate phosphatase